MTLDLKVEPAPGTVVVLQGSGLTMVPDPAGVGPLGIAELTALTHQGPGAYRPGAAPPSADSLRTGELMVRTPLVLGVSASGFECRDHDGRLLETLDAAELAAAAELRRASSARDGWDRHVAACGDHALAEPDSSRCRHGSSRPGCACTSNQEAPRSRARTARIAPGPRQCRTSTASTRPCNEASATTSRAARRATSA